LKFIALNQLIKLFHNSKIFGLAVIIFNLGTYGSLATIDTMPNLGSLMLESDGMECDRQNNTCKASGNVVVMKGNFNLKSQILITKLRKNKLGKQEIWQVEAIGNVKFKGSADEIASAPYALYNIDDDKLILKASENGEPIFPHNKHLYPTLQKGQHLVRAKEISIYFIKSSTNVTALKYVEAKGDVILSTPLDLAHGDFATYDPTTRLAKLTGNVVIARDSGQISGTYAEVKLDTGTSKMLSVAPGIKGLKKRVQVLLKPTPSDHATHPLAK
jgi:lipopolysaccharide export system protein LptA